MAGIDNNTVLYLRGDSFKDLSLSPKTITNNGVVIEERNLKFGNGYLTSSNPFSNLDEFTIDFYINLNSSSVDYSGILGCSSAGAVDVDNFEIYYLKSSTSLCVHYRTVTKKIDFSSYLGKITHLAFVKKDNTLNIFIDGVLKHTYSDANMIFNDSNLLRLGKIRDNTISPICTINNFRISNTTRYMEDFTPPNQPFNSININVTNKTATQIDFNVTKLSQETINKVEVLQGNVVKETYTDNYDNLTYNIDNSLCSIGNNKITIRVTYDDNYIEEKVVTHTVTVNNLPTTSSLKDVIDRQELLNNSIEIQKNNLKNILVGKNVEVEEENKLSNLIDKVNELGDAPPPPLYLYKNGDECVDVTGGIEILFKWEVANYGNNSFGNKHSNYIRLEANGVNGQESGIGAYTANKIDLTKYSKLNFEYLSENFAHSKGVMFSASNDKPTSCYKGDNKVAYVFETENPTNEITTLTIDISQITGSYYISGVARASGASTCKADLNIYKIWLEK